MALLARAVGNILQFSNNCFYKFSVRCIKLKLNKKLHPRLTPCIQSPVNSRFLNTDVSSTKGKRKTKYLTFDDTLSRRRDQAQRSIVVQVQSEQSTYELYNYCSLHGKVREMHHYTTNGSVHFVLIEFDSLSDVNSISSVFTHNDEQYLPVVSPMVWFRAAANGGKNGSISKDIPLKVINARDFPTPQTIKDRLFKAESISDQMKILFNSTKLNDTDTRLRFLTARQIETCLSGLFSDISVLPFGSSVNGFGKQGCDLDLVLKLRSDIENNLSSRLVYHTKAGGTNERIQAERVMGTISDVMDQFLPGVTSIRRILKARVPIIKYVQSLTGLECDLSMTNTIGIHMSELLYLYGELDSRVRPLTFTVRMWANYVQLTNSAPGHWITNFSLTLLVVFYLQQKQILPSLQYLVQLANKDDFRIADGCVDCTFLRDISRLPKSTQSNKDTLEDLLNNFFIFYSSFDFLTKAISINTGTSLPKPSNSNVFIYNPLEQGLNVTKNMNVQETERLKVEMRNAAWVLDSISENKTDDWGLLLLFHQRLHSATPTGIRDKGRLLQFSSLFNKSQIANSASKDSSDAESTSNSGDPNSKNSTPSKRVDKRVASNLKMRSIRTPGWRR